MNGAARWVNAPKYSAPAPPRLVVVGLGSSSLASPSLPSPDRNGTCGGVGSSDVAGTVDVWTRQWERRFSIIVFFKK